MALLSMCALAVACAEVPVVSRARHEECLTLVCSHSKSVCALFRCEDVTAGAGNEGQIILARGSGVLLLPPGSTQANRYWGSAQGLPEDRLPVFVIPWHNHDRTPLLPPGVQQAIQEHAKGPGRLVKHHLFPQRIHLGPRGGPWNAAWRQFIDLDNEATKEEIWRYAGELIHRFDIDGPILPYYGRVALPCSLMTVR